MKHPTLIRERVLKRTVDMLEHLRIQVSMLPETEIDVLRVLERPQQYDLAVDLANILMERLGHVAGSGPCRVTPDPKEPRYDKTRRALGKLRPARGARTFHPEQEFVVGQLQARRGSGPAIAAAAGVPYSAVNKIMAGTGASPGASNIAKLAAYFRAQEQEVKNNE